MLVTNSVFVKWNSKNIKYYTSKGYIYTKMGDEFEVDTKDLLQFSTATVETKCDLCGEIFNRKFVDHIKTKAKKWQYADVCRKCYPQALSTLFTQQYNKIHFTKLEIYKKVLNCEMKNFPKSFWVNLNKSDLKEMILYFIDLLIKDKIILNIDELPKKISHKLLRQYYLYALVQIHFSSIYDILEMIFPNRWKPWQYKFISQDFWTIKDNRINALNWFVDILIKDKVIHSIEDIPRINNLRQLTVKYSLSGLFNYSKSSPSLFWDTLFPNKWDKWEYYSTSKNYWSIRINRINAMKSFIETLGIDLFEIPNFITYSFVKEHCQKFTGVCDKYYHSSFYNWIDECYPNTFTKKDFFNNVSKDGIKLLSNEEKIIHEWLIDNYKNVKYIENPRNTKNKFYNKYHNEKYVPDWIIDNKIIIEYFGLYNEKQYNKSEIITNYIDKTHKKIFFFSNLNGYKFIGLFPQDLKNNMQSVKEKLNKYIN